MNKKLKSFKKNITVRELWDYVKDIFHEIEIDEHPLGFFETEIKNLVEKEEGLYFHYREGGLKSYWLFPWDSIVDKKGDIFFLESSIDEEICAVKFFKREAIVL